MRMTIKACVTRGRRSCHWFFGGTPARIFHARREKFGPDRGGHRENKGQDGSWMPDPGFRILITDYWVVHRRSSIFDSQSSILHAPLPQTLNLLSNPSSGSRPSTLDSFPVLDLRPSTVVRVTFDAS